eukprot:CAMPEP_0172502936 /NCGR_PEP_ID=MMETSP1066-20121228/164323_1 /TAXON_ID=671091 /ORGANISM="Coscinodiscus wailesii, Strain CCMP2513" /LENGTH=54 /DNA_ID=CAMNT_0013278417 /DNA_START=39 /DNA_END=199 /DNA_ORIENTATION=+
MTHLRLEIRSRRVRPDTDGGIKVIISSLLLSSVVEDEDEVGRPSLTGSPLQMSP